MDALNAAGTMGVAFAARPLARAFRMDAQPHATAHPAEERLRSLFLAGLAGDGAQYRQFLSALSGHLRAYLRRRMAQWPDDVEDLVQESLLAVHNHRHTWQAEQALTPWVHTIARYKLVDWLRARSRHEALHDPIDDEMELFVRSDTEASDARRDLEQMLAELPERQRRALVMMKIGGASVAETARATGLSEAAVKTGVHRSLKALAAKFRSTP